VGPPATGRARLRVGYQIFGWGRHFPVSWWRGAEAVAAVGFRGVEGEYTIAECYEGREEEFLERMHRVGVRLAALYSTTDLDRPGESYENRRKNLQAAALLERAGARVIVLGGTEARNKGPETYATYVRDANELGRRVHEEHGVRLGVHPHVGSLVETREDIARVMDGTDPRFFFLAPDTGHLLAGGSDPVEVFRTYGQRIVHVHLKDYAPPESPGARGAFLPLGQGRIDFPALVNVLQRSSFDGWLNVELDGRGGLDGTDVARRAREYVETRLGLSLEQPEDRRAARAVGGGQA
jgi:inosose dehydratase